MFEIDQYYTKSICRKGKLEAPGSAFLFRSPNPRGTPHDAERRGGISEVPSCHLLGDSTAPSPTNAPEHLAGTRLIL